MKEASRARKEGKEEKANVNTKVEDESKSIHGIFRGIRGGGDHEEEEKNDDDAIRE